MKIYEIDGKKYRLPNELTDFQLQMYIHLINWKWAHLTQESESESTLGSTRPGLCP